MKCPKCNFEQADQNLECIRCGIVFEKYQTSQGSIPKPDTHPKQSDLGASIKDLIFYVNPTTNPLAFGCRALFFIGISIWSFIFIFSSIESNCVGKSLWHMVNLPFHEAGHIFFRPFGRVITSLGGSLTQLLMPLVCLFVLLLKTRDSFGASFSLWWFGENFLDLAPYINDARSLTLPLLGGNTGRSAPYGFHDWQFILNELGLIRYDHTLAWCSHIVGSLLMIASFLWGGYILYQQYKNLR